MLGSIEMDLISVDKNPTTVMLTYQCTCTLCDGQSGLQKYIEGIYMYKYNKYLLICNNVKYNLSKRYRGLSLERQRSIQKYNYRIFFKKIIINEH